MKALTLLLFVLLLTSCSESDDLPADSTLSDSSLSTKISADTDSLRYKTSREDWSLGFMAVVANPYATEAAAEMLAQGGHAVDAAIAAHAVLGLVEPESSGLGGGGFMMVYERATGQVRFLDGRESAPAGASADMFMAGGEVMGFLDAWQSGKAVGVPGAVALYRLAHDNFGVLPWEALFEPAIRLANEGFVVSEKLADFLPRMANLSRLDENPGASEYFYPDGQPVQAGQLLRNPEYADTLSRIATGGPAAFYHGDIAEAIASAARAEPNGGSLTTEDIANYRARERPAICRDWRDLSLCSATPPSSGAMQIMLANLYDRLLPENPGLSDRVRTFVDAQRLAYADRDYYFGDPDLVDVPLDQLLDPRYLEFRAGNPAPPDGIPAHGDPADVLGGQPLATPGADSTLEPAGTTHFSIVDNEGNAVAMTMTVESAFGSARWAAGFLLNNELTDFARAYDPERPEAANAVRPGARPRSSMSPTIILDPDGELFMVTGSPGGNSIPAYTAKTVLGVVDWGLSVQDAVNFPNIIARGEIVRVETGREPGPQLADQLRQAGYNVQESAGENSGLNVILVGKDELMGAADPRREGTVMASNPL